MVLCRNLVLFLTSTKNVIPNWADYEDPVVPLSAIDFEDDEMVVDTFSFNDSKTNLEQLFVHRSPSSSLTNRNILKAENVAPSLAATQQAVKFKILADYLGHKLEKRPSFDHLLSTNIIKAPLYVSSLLQNPRQQLQFNQTLVHLETRMYHRPPRDFLVMLNIIKGEAAPSLQSIQQCLKFRRMKDTLDHKLEQRPNVSYLLSQNILKETTVSNNLQAAQQSLRFHVAQATLDHKLKETFRTKKEFSAFEFTRAAADLKQKLATRVSLNKLLGDGILQDSRRVARSLQGSVYSLRNRTFSSAEDLFDVTAVVAVVNARDNSLTNERDV